MITMHVFSFTVLGLVLQYVSGECEYNTTLRPIEKRLCVYGLITCVHGYCNEWTQPCFCDPHWTGDNCNRLSCPGECFQTCELCGDLIRCPVVEITTTLELTATTPTSESIYTKRTIKPNRTTHLVSSVTETTVSTIKNNNTTESTINQATNDTWPYGHVCSENYNLRSLGERYCNGIFCKYGRCETTSSGDKRCVCDPDATGDLCEKTCCKLCGEVTCMVINATETCIDNKPGKDKYIHQQHEETWYWIVVGVCVGLIVLLVLALVVLPYWMWRNRVILIMKIVHYFQKYEDDDERQWDAFISYKCEGEDEAFVLKQLYKRLELDLGFKLCLHFRDFTPGEVVANNIINAIGNSRRTILVLTPRFIESEWTKFEYQQAQHEMLNKKHRIIPIILEDISSVEKDMDKNLQQIIRSVTYLEWPGEENSSKLDKFWTRLTLSMPKKKSVDDSKKISDLEFISTSKSDKTETYSSYTSNEKTKKKTKKYSLNIESSDKTIISNNGITTTSLKPIVV